MQELKLIDYTRINSHFNTVIKQLNAVELTDKAKEQLDNLSAININAASILDNIKIEKVSKLPNFLDYLKAGINLASSVPHCEHTSPCLQLLEQTIKALETGTYTDLLKGVSYSKKKNGFVLNEVGIQMVDATIIRLNKAQAEMYNHYKNIYNSTVANSASPYHSACELLPKFAFMSSIDGLRFLEDSTAKQIKMWLK